MIGHRGEGLRKLPQETAAATSDIEKLEIALILPSDVLGDWGNRLRRIAPAEPMNRVST